jgi:hypothetical protein
MDNLKHSLTNYSGPMYGLRMLVYVNASDYMPTTEATGVRLTIHDKEDFPYPDTFGYSAPTGFISSFGLRLVIIILIYNKPKHVDFSEKCHDCQVH